MFANFLSPTADQWSSPGSLASPLTSPRRGRQISSSRRPYRGRAGSESTVATEADVEQALGSSWWAVKHEKLYGCSSNFHIPLEEPLLPSRAASASSMLRLAPVGRALAATLALVLTLGTGAAAGWSARASWSTDAAGKLPDATVQVRGERRRLSVMGRDVWIYAPLASQLVNRSMPAVVVLHGSEDHPRSIANATHFEELAEASAEPFLAVFPEMSTPGGEMWGYQDDLPFFRALVDKLDVEYSLRRDEVFVCGHSAGGSMSLFLQNNLADVFHGAAAVEAGIGGEKFWDDASSGRPTMVVWNHNDPVLWEFGGEALLNKTLGKLQRHALPGSSAPSFSIPVATHNASAVKGARQLLYGASALSPQLAVVSWETTEPTHHWSNPESVPGSFDASALVWEFFQNTRASRTRAP